MVTPRSQLLFSRFVSLNFFVLRTEFSWFYNICWNIWSLLTEVIAILIVRNSMRKNIFLSDSSKRRRCIRRWSFDSYSTLNWSNATIHYTFSKLNPSIRLLLSTTLVLITCRQSLIWLVRFIYRRYLCDWALNTCG